MAGGDNLETSVEFLNLDTLIWEPKQSLPIDIRHAASVPFQDSFLIVVGNSYYQGYLNTVYYYNPESERWQLMN